MYSFIWETEFTEWETERILHLLIYSPNGHNSRGWTRSKAGTENSILVFQMGTGAQVFGSSSTAFPGASQESWARSVSARTQTNVHTDYWCLRQWLNDYATTLALIPILFFLESESQTFFPYRNCPGVLRNSLADGLEKKKSAGSS